MRVFQSSLSPGLAAKKTETGAAAGNPGDLYNMNGHFGNTDDLSGFEPICTLQGPTEGSNLGAVEGGNGEKGACVPPC